MHRRDRSGSSRSYDRDGRGRSGGPAPNRDVRDPREAERAGLQWVRVDLHLHTPASSDYRDPDATYLQILQRAEDRGLDIIAFADHNSVQGYARMLKEIETLELLERLGRLNDQEAHDLAEYRRLRETLLVLPGFEFTATFGFHILGIFPPGTSLRKIELLLLKLDVPEAKMLAGAPDAGPTSDVIEAYEAIHEAGGLPIAAHANSSNGVAMQGFNFGGQTKIAYTQHSALAALEVTDLEQSGRRTTESFFNGSKPEYPRRMHCIQGSDAHSIDKEPGEGPNKRLGVGDRCTEMLLSDITFEAMRDLFASHEFDRTRPYRPGQEVAYDFVRQARGQGPSIVQAFHERASTKTSRTRAVLRDIVAFANTSGGTIYCGVSADENVPVRGVENVEETTNLLRFDVQRGITPPLDVTFASHISEGRPVLLLQVPRGSDRPYMYEPAGQIYIRQETDSIQATRDDIVRLVLEAHGERLTAELAAAALSVPTSSSAETAQAVEQAEELLGEMVEEAVTGASVPVDVAHRRRRRRRRSGEGRAAAPTSTEAEEVPDTAPGWTTSPAWDAPEDNPEEAGPDEATAAAEALAEFGDRHAAEAAVALDEAEEEAEPAPETEAAPTRPTRRKGRLYQVYKGELGEPPVGNAQRERRAGLYADKAGELLDAALRAANPEGMFELERNQLWLPEGVEPALPKGLVAAPRGKNVINDTLLNAKSGPGGQFQSAAELAPPEPEPEPEPETSAPKRRPSRRGRKSSATAEAPETPETPETPAAPAADTKGAAAEGPRVLPGEKLSGARMRAAATEKAEAPAAAPARANGKSAAPRPSAPAVPSPRTGVEVVNTEVRNGVPYHSMRDLRNGSVVHNVTRYSARRLWYYAIMRHEAGPPEPQDVQWNGNVGLWRKVRRANVLRYDLVAREPDGSLRVYYGVTEDGIHGPWREVDLAAADADQAENEHDWN